MTRSGRRTSSGRVTAIAGLACLMLATTACGGKGSNSDASQQTSGATITVALASDPPPKAALDAFTSQTGIKVNWVNIDWDSLQTKISAAATAKTYFADATNVDWSRVGQLGKLNWFHPLEQFLDTSSMEKDVPQLPSFMSGGHVVGVPYDASFMVTTVNKQMFAKAGLDPAPKTIQAYTQELEQLRAKGIVQHPLNIPFAAAEGLSTYWYQTTAAFGGTILDANYKPQFTDPSSAGYKAAEWMIDALKKGLVPPGNINVSDSQGQQTLMAQGQVASTFSDYSGIVGTVYNIPSSSSVVGQIQYIPSPAASGTSPNLSNPDGIGIPRQAKYPQAAAKFIQWFTDPANQVDFTGVNGPDKAMPYYTMPSHLSAVEELTKKGHLIGGDALSAMLKNSKPVFAGGAPAWYPRFSNAVYTNLHDAATGAKSVSDAIAAIASAADNLSSGS